MKNNTQISDPSQRGERATTSRIKAATQKIAELEGRIEAAIDQDIKKLEKTTKNMDKAFGQFSKKHSALTTLLILVVVSIAVVIIYKLTAGYYAGQ